MPQTHFITPDGRFDRPAIRAAARQELEEFLRDYPGCKAGPGFLRRQALRSALMAALPEKTRWDFANFQNLIAVSPAEARQLSTDGRL